MDANGSGAAQKNTWGPLSASLGLGGSFVFFISQQRSPLGFWGPRFPAFGPRKHMVSCRGLWGTTPKKLRRRWADSNNRAPWLCKERSQGAAQRITCCQSGTGRACPVLAWVLTCRPPPPPGAAPFHGSGEFVFVWARQNLFNHEFKERVSEVSASASECSGMRRRRSATGSPA